MVYRVDRNNFYDNEKKATIYTPPEASEFLFNILEEHISKSDIIFDPCVGGGSLLLPWKKANYSVVGIDIEDQGFQKTKVANYLALTERDLPRKKVGLVIMNPPFNIDAKTKAYVKAHYGGRPLLPEVWLSKAIDLFGKNVPIVMFTPYGFRLNQTEKSARWLKFANEEYPEISSIISLPKDIFDGILFHCEILCFNMPNLKPHYFINTGKQNKSPLFN